MDITEVAIRPINDGIVRADVDIVFDNCFMVEGIKIIKASGKFLISFPSKKQRDGSHRDLAFPANAETRRMIEQAILAQYEKWI